jgi:hypothetical protein
MKVSWLNVCVDAKDTDVDSAIEVGLTNAVRNTYISYGYRNGYGEGGYHSHNQKPFHIE